MSRTRYCTVCQKPVQAIGGIFSSLKCPMCRNSGTLQSLTEDSSIGWFGTVFILVLIGVLIYGGVVFLLKEQGGGFGWGKRGSLGSGGEQFRSMGPRNQETRKPVPLDPNLLMPLEAEIELLKVECANLSREDDRYYDQVARQKMQVKQLSARIAKTSEDLAGREARIKTLREALAEGNEFVVFEGARYSRQDAQNEVRLDTTRFLADEKLLKQDKENLKILEQTLTANKSKLEGLTLRRREMQARLLDLETQLAQQRLLEQPSMTVDDSRYNKVLQQIEEVGERIEMQRTKAELRGDAVKGPTSLQEEKKAKERQLEKAIEEHFGKGGAGKVTSR